MNTFLFLFSGKMVNDVFSGYVFEPYDIESSFERRLRRHEARAQIRARADEFWTSIITIEQRLQERLSVRFHLHARPVAISGIKIRK